MRESEVQRYVLGDQIPSNVLGEQQFEIRELSPEEQAKADEALSIPRAARRIPGYERVSLGSDPDRLWDKSTKRWIIDSTLLPS